MPLRAISALFRYSPLIAFAYHRWRRLAWASLIIRARSPLHRPHASAELLHLPPLPPLLLPHRLSRHAGSPGPGFTGRSLQIFPAPAIACRLRSSASSSATPSPGWATQVTNAPAALTLLYFNVRHSAFIFHSRRDIAIYNLFRRHATANTLLFILLPAFNIISNIVYNYFIIIYADHFRIRLLLRNNNNAYRNINITP